MNYLYGIFVLTAAPFTYMHLTQARHSLWLYRYERTLPGMLARPHRQRHHLYLFLFSICCMLLFSLLTLYDAFLFAGLF